MHTKRMYIFINYKGNKCTYVLIIKEINVHVLIIKEINI